MLAMGRSTNTDPIVSDMISQQVEDSIEKCIQLYKEMLSRKKPIRFHTVDISQAFQLINDYIEINESNNSSLINSSVTMAMEELSTKSFKLSPDELTIYISRELGLYYFFGGKMELAKENFDRIFALKQKIKTPLVHDYNFDRLEKFKNVVEDTLNKKQEAKPITKDLHKKLNELFNSPNDFLIKELTFTDNDMEIVLKLFKDIISTKNNEQLASISDSLRYCARFVLFSNKELLEDLVVKYNYHDNNYMKNESDISFPTKKHFDIIPLENGSGNNAIDLDSTDSESSLEILSNLEISCNDIVASFPPDFVSEYFSVKTRNVTALNQNFFDSFLFEDIKNAAIELIAYYQNDKTKVHIHLKSLRMLCQQYEEFITTIEQLQLSTVLHVVLSKCFRLGTDSLSVDKQISIRLLESLVQFVHSISVQLDQTTYEKVVTVVEAEILYHNIIAYSSKPNTNFVKESNNLLEQVAKFKSFQLHTNIYIAIYTHFINCEEYHLLTTFTANSVNNEPIGHLSNVLGAFFLPQSSSGVSPDSLKNLFDLFDVFNECSDSSIHSTININLSHFKKWIDDITNVKFISGILSMFVSVYNFVIIDKTRSNLIHVSELTEFHFNLKNKNVSTISNMLLLKLIVIVSDKLLQLNFLISTQLLHTESLYLLGDSHGCLKSFAISTVYFLKDIVGDHGENELFNNFIDQTTAVRIADCFAKTDRPLEAVCILQPFINILNGGIIETNVDDIVCLMKASRVNIQLLELIYDSGLLSILSDSFLKDGLKDVYAKLIEISSATENSLNNPNFLTERIVVAKKVKLFNHIQNTCLTNELKRDRHCSINEKRDIRYFCL